MPPQSELIDAGDGRGVDGDLYLAFRAVIHVERKV